MNEHMNESPKRYYIGWDVGAWHCAERGEGSKDAIAIFNEQLQPVGRFREGNLSYAVLDVNRAQKPGEWLLAELFKWCDAKWDNQEQVDVCIAIDTPLGWPSAFLKLLAHWNIKQPSDSFDSSVIDLEANKIYNPLLHRQTETLLGQSLSSVQDQIGSQSTKAICLLANLKAQQFSTGVWKTRDPNITFIETYPAPCMRSFKFLDSMKGIGLNSSVTSADIFDAIVCALVAKEYSSPTNNVGLTVPTSHDDAEGWIFTPDDHLSADYGVSYGRLIELQSPQKHFDELLSQVQMSIVMTALLKWQASKSKKTSKATTHPIPDQIAKWLQNPDASANAWKNATADDLKSLFKLLHPKAKKDNVPSDDQFANVALALNGKATP